MNIFTYIYDKIHLREDIQSLITGLRRYSNSSGNHQSSEDQFVQLKVGSKQYNH